MNFYVCEAFSIGNLLCAVGLLVMAGEEEISVVLLVAADAQSSNKHKQNGPHFIKCMRQKLFVQLPLRNSMHRCKC
jgi:hypothetical protein